jgi:hypothetical protein
VLVKGEKGGMEEAPENEISYLSVGHYGTPEEYQACAVKLWYWDGSLHVKPVDPAAPSGHWAWKLETGIDITKWSYSGRYDSCKHVITCARMKMSQAGPPPKYLIYELYRTFGQGNVIYYEDEGKMIPLAANWYGRLKIAAGIRPGYWVSPDGSQVIPTYNHDADAPKLPGRPRDRRDALAKGWIRIHVDRGGSGECQIEGVKGCNEQQVRAIMNIWPSLPCKVVVVDMPSGGGNIANDTEELEKLLAPNCNWKSAPDPSLFWEHKLPPEKPEHWRL